MTSYSSLHHSLLLLLYTGGKCSNITHTHTRTRTVLMATLVTTPAAIYIPPFCVCVCVCVCPRRCLSPDTKLSTLILHVSKGHLCLDTHTHTHTHTHTRAHERAHERAHTRRKTQSIRANDTDSLPPPLQFTPTGALKTYLNNNPPRLAYSCMLLKREKKKKHPNMKQTWPFAFTARLHNCSLNFHRAPLWSGARCRFSNVSRTPTRFSSHRLVGGWWGSVALPCP